MVTIVIIMVIVMTRRMLIGINPLIITSCKGEVITEALTFLLMVQPYSFKSFPTPQSNVYSQRLENSVTQIPTSHTHIIHPHHYLYFPTLNTVKYIILVYCVWNPPILHNGMGETPPLSHPTYTYTWSINHQLLLLLLLLLLFKWDMGVEWKSKIKDTSSRRRVLVQSNESMYNNV